MTTTSFVSHADLDDARLLLAGVARVTPVETCRLLSGLVGGPVAYKCENLQRTGSFKVRGAYVRLARMAEADRRRGVVAASAGNHAQGVALAASLLGTTSTIFMPRLAPLPKLEATRGYGAEVRLVGESVDDALTAARLECEQTGRTLIHPFDHPDVIIGQATVGAEFLEQRDDLRTLLVPVGGGGLISGVAAAVRLLKPDVRVVGIQAANMAAFPGSIAAGYPVAIPRGVTMADGIAVGCPGELTLRHIISDVDEVITVSEDAIARAVLFCMERGKLVVEPAGAVGVAALLEAPQMFEPPVGLILSGGNIDPLLTMKVLRHGLSAAGRHLSLRLRLSDSPGELAQLLTQLAAHGANVLEVEQTRLGARKALDDVDVTVQLEMRGAEHQNETVAALTAAGYHLAP